MPTSLVRTKEDEKAWEQAKQVAAKAGHAKDYDYVVEVFQRILKRGSPKGKRPRAITYEMDQKERAAIKREAKELGYTHDKMGKPVKLEESK